MNTMSRHVMENASMLIKTVVYATDFNREDFNNC